MFCQGVFQSVSELTFLKTILSQYLVSLCFLVGVWTWRQVNFCLNVCFPFWMPNEVTLTLCVFQLLPHHWSKHVILFVLSGHPVGHLWLPLTVPWCCCLPGVPRRRIKCSSPLDGCDCVLLLLLQLLLQHIFIPPMYSTGGSLKHWSTSEEKSKQVH